jgi:hypothetical protein
MTVIERAYVQELSPAISDPLLVRLMLLHLQGAPSTAGTAALKYRTLRLAHSIHVVPLLLVRPTVASSPADLSAHLLRLDMEGSRVSE